MHIYKQNKWIYCRLSILAIILIIAIVSSCNSKIKYDDIVVPPSDAAKKIVTSYHNPLVVDNEIICGEEISDFEHTRNTVYYDEFDNILLSIDHKNGKVERKYYFSAKDKMLDKQFSIENSNQDEIKEKYYIRDTDGRLLFVIDQENDTISEYKYDENQDIVILEFNDYKREKIIRTKPAQLENKNIVLIEKFDKNNKYSYKGKKNLTERIYQIIDSNKFVKKEIIERIEYGELFSHLEKEYTYFKEDKKSSIITKGIKIAGDDYYSVPSDLRGEEIDVYIKEHYYNRKLTYDSIYNEVSVTYNSQGDITNMLSIESTNGKFRLDKYNSFRREYKYNSKNDWIQVIEFKNELFSDFHSSSLKAKTYNSLKQTTFDNPSIIVNREITYLK